MFCAVRSWDRDKKGREDKANQSSNETHPGFYRRMFLLGMSLAQDFSFAVCGSVSPFDLSVEVSARLAKGWQERVACVSARNDLGVDYGCGSTCSLEKGRRRRRSPGSRILLGCSSVGDRSMVLSSLLFTTWVLHRSVDSQG